MNKRKRWYLALLGAAAIASSLVAAAPAIPAHASAPSLETRQDLPASEALCFNRHAGGTGVNTAVVGWGCNSQGDDFNVEFLSLMCTNGRVNPNSNPVCPFPNGSGLNSRFQGWYIVSYNSYQTGKCLGGETQTEPNGSLQACPDDSGFGGGWSTSDIISNNNNNTPSPVINLRQTIDGFYNRDAIPDYVSDCVESPHGAAIFLGEVSSDGLPEGGCDVWYEEQF